MVDSAISKVGRAERHVDELAELFREKRPFSYVLSTNTKTGERATLAKKDEAVVNEAANIAADIVHNLRTSLDHAYWEIVSPHAHNAKEERTIQFPFSETSARLAEAIKSRLADRVSPAFSQTLMDLKPYGEPGGNEMLYLVHQLDALDKHRFPTPMGNYTRLSSDIIRRQVPDFPAIMVDCHFGMNDRDVVWRVPPMSWAARKKAGLLTHPVLEQELNVPVEIVFGAGSKAIMRPVIPTSRALVDVTKDAIQAIRGSISGKTA
jgi:hypothetical protein